MFELSLALEIHYDNLAVELINYVRQTMADERHLPVDPSELKFLPAEQFTQLEIPVPDFQKLISSRFIVRAVQEGSHSETPVLEMIGYEYRLADWICRVNLADGLWPAWLDFSR